MKKPEAPKTGNKSQTEILKNEGKKPFKIDEYRNQRFLLKRDEL